MSMKNNITKESSLTFTVISILFIVAFVLFSAYKLHQTKLTPPRFDQGKVKNLQISGALKNVNSQMISQKIAHLLAEDIVNLDMTQIQQTIEDMPWVRTAEVVRIYPSTIKVAIKEQIPVAIWNGKSYLNQYGEIFNAPDIEDKEMLTKLNGKNEKAKVMLKLYSSLKNSIATDMLQTIFQNENGVYRLKLNNGTEVVLGRKQLNQRINRLTKMLDLIESHTQVITRIDLRYRKGMAIKFSERINNG